MKIKRFEELHRSSGLIHKWVAQQIRIMSDADDKVGEMYWLNIRKGKAAFPTKYRGRKVKKLAEIYGVSVDKIIDLFNLNNRSKNLLYRFIGILPKGIR